MARINRPEINRPEQSQKKLHIKKKNLIWLGRVLTVLLAAVGIFFILIVGTVIVLRIGGKNHLYGSQKEQVASMKQAMETAVDKTETMPENEGEGEEEWQDGWIRRNGKIYAYNEDVLTFLFLGVDKMEKVKEAKNGIDGGQSDAIFMLVLNPHTKETSVIGVNRDTMTDIEVYDKQGNYVTNSIKQLTLQHGYGDGKELSCERSRDAVSKLFYNLPIHGYCAINMGAVSLLNDAIGGVEVQSLETLRTPGAVFKEGQQYALKGMDAYWYVKYRDTKLFNSAGLRLERQKQYLNAYIAKAKGAVKADITVPVKLYNTLAPYMVTDVTLDEVSYLATEALDYTFQMDNIYSLKGETIQGERFEEFYPDEEALYQLILDVFYEEVE